jgi:hypothetical protein
MPFTKLPDTLYHGSDVAVASIDLSFGVPKKDFGRGFYTTHDIKQAEKFARLKARRANEAKGFVSVFSLKRADDLLINEFDTVGEEWFDFVLCNRGYPELAVTTETASYDIVIGPVANDAVGLVLNQFVSGTFGNPKQVESKETAIRLLLTQKLHDQVFFGTEQAVARLNHLEVYDVSAE